jgi:hypothetical protein
MPNAAVVLYYFIWHVEEIGLFELVLWDQYWYHSGSFHVGKKVFVVSVINFLQLVEILQFHCILSQFYWSSDLPVCCPSWGTRVQSPAGILLLALTRYKLHIHIFAISIFFSSRQLLKEVMFHDCNLYLHNRLHKCGLKN